MESVTIVEDDSIKHLFTNQLRKHGLIRDNLNYNIIYPVQNKQILDNSGTAPENVDLIIPNNNFIIVSESYMTIKLKIVIGTTAAGDLIIQKNGRLYKKLSLDGSSSVIKTLPVSTRGFFDRVQVTKPNQHGTGLDFVQQRKYRDVHTYGLYDQAYVNQFSDYLFYNNDDKVIYECTQSADANQFIWFTCNIPLAEISPLFGVHPLFPMPLLNSHIQIGITTNVPVLSDIGIGFADFSLKICTMQNNKLSSLVRGNKQTILGTFNNYKPSTVINSQRGQHQTFFIQQAYKSLDSIVVQAFGAENLMHKKGWSNIASDLSTGTTIAPYNVQVEVAGSNLFTKQAQTLQDLYRINCFDNNQSTSFYSGCPEIFSIHNFLKYNNSVYIKLDDYSGGEQVPAAGFTGISISQQSNAQVSWQLANYSAATINPVVDSTSTAVSYEVICYYSDIMQITPSGDVYVGDAVKMK